MADVDGTVGGSVDPERLVGERIAGRFVVERLIGRGDLSTAFRAHDDRLHRRVTVKLFHPRHRDDVQVVHSQLAAARAVARLSHEHIAMVIDRGEHDGMPLVVLEHVRGENLHERIERYAPLAVGEVVGYALQIARALAYAHGHAVMHGNLRPGNVLLTEERAVKLVDFGGGSYVARLVGDPFAAPELRELDADAAPEPTDDVFALGALIVAGLTERAPSPGMDASELLVQRPDVSPRLASVVAHAVAHDPADRLQTMREFASELASLRDGATGVEPAQETRGFSRVELDDARGLATPRGGDTAEQPTAGAVRVPRQRRGRAARRVRSPHEVRARILAWSVVVVPILGLVLFGVMIAGERARQGVDGADAINYGPVGDLVVKGAVSFDPPPGDGIEHPEKLANLLDDDPDTTWETEGYDTQSFNGQKDGVGVVLQLAGDADVRDVVIETRLPNWVVQVRAAKRPSATLDGWRAVSDPTPVETGAQIPVDLEGHPTRYLLLWITKLAIDPDDADRSRARAAHVTVVGAPVESAR